MNQVLDLLQEWIPVVKDFILAVTAIIAGYVGLKGLGTWRRQLRGNTEYQLAKQLLKSVYELREAISSVRNPFVTYSREPDLPEEDLQRLSREEKQWHIMVQVYQKRWIPISEVKSTLDSTLLEAKVIWGTRIVDKVLPLYDLTGELYLAIQDHLEAVKELNKTHKESSNTEEQEARKKRLLIIFARGSAEGDEFKTRLDTAIASIEEELKPHIAHYHR